MRACVLVLFGLVWSMGLAGSCPAATIDSLKLVRDGVSDFVICLSKDASTGSMAAARTLRDYLRRISGAELPVLQGAGPAQDCIVIEVGNPALDPQFLESLGEDGFHMESDSRRLTLTSRTSRGAQNAVHSLLETYLGCRKYSPSVEVVPRRSTITLPPIDDTQIPELTFRLQDFRDSSYAAWHKLSSLEDWGLFVHTFKTLVPPEAWFKDHPEYFSEVAGLRVADGQLCLSNPEVLRIVIEELRHRMREKPDARYWSVSQNDTYLPCSCAACRAVDDEEGSPAGSLLRFVNQVAADFPDKTISTLAYEYSRAAPTHTRPAPNVNIMLCSIECDRSRPITDSPQDASFVKDLQDWCRLTHNIFLWDYVIQFRNLVSPFPNLRVLQPNLQFFVDNGINSVFEQGVSVMEGEFAELRAYLISKLLWNPRIDLDAVMNDFLRGYYGDAAPHIRQYIDSMHDALAASGEGLSCFGYPSPSANGYLSAGMIDGYQRSFALAEAAVADQPELLFRVRTARLPLQYAQLEQAKILADGERGCFERDSRGERRMRPHIEALLDTFCVRCGRAGITKLWEHGIPPQHYLETTRRFLTESTEAHLALNRPVLPAMPPSDKYHDGEPAALTDGLVGWDDYHMHWLGFEGEDMDLTIDLGQPLSISRIETAFLQDIASWIFMPFSMEVLCSTDGRQFQSLGLLPNKIDPHREGALRTPLTLKFPPVSTRLIRVKALGLKQCPPWHKGAGGKAWVFCDEIKVF